MADEFYGLPDNPVYHEEIRRIQNGDRVNAETVLNPVFQALLDNIHYLYLRGDAGRKPLAVRIRDPTKPAYGLDCRDDGTVPVVLETSPYDGAAEVSVIVSDTEYKADNMRKSGTAVPNGTLLFKNVEE